MNKRKWWKISNSVSLVFLVLMGLIWVNATTKYDPNKNQLTNEAEVDKHLSENFPSLPQKRIPTGVFIQSLKFNSSSEVNFTGYVWQIFDQSEYKDTSDKDIPVGFILPETVESGSNIAPKLAFRDKMKGNKEVIAWYFESTLKQSFDYSRYPFDHKTVWIRFWSRDFNRKTILVPSFASYKSTKLTDAFGYDKNIVLGTWKLLNTFFDYRKEDYNTTFGIYGKGVKDNQPELYFNIVIKRRFLNSFIVYILPLAIIACLVFATLMMITKDGEQASIFGINTSGIIGVCSGLFFVVLVSQVQIREEFAGSSIVYVEFFYPLIYISLLGVSVNSFIFSSSKKEYNSSFTNWINYQDNIIPKLIYWPVLLGSATIITAVTLLPEHQKLGSSKSQEQSFLPDMLLSRESTFLPFNVDKISFKNPTKTTYQTSLSMSSFGSMGTENREQCERRFSKVRYSSLTHHPIICLL